MKKTRLTINDIAKLANVSRSTVSRALNNNPEVSKETKERIQAVIEQYHYHPSTYARRMVTKSCDTIGLYIGERLKVHHASAQVLQGVIEKSTSENFDIIICGGKTEEQLVEMYQGGQVEGFIVLNPHANARHQLSVLEQNSIPYICTAECGTEGEFYCVDIDNEKASYDMMEYLLSLGHRKFAFVFEVGDTVESISYRFKGCKKKLAQCGIHVPEDHILRLDISNRKIPAEILQGWVSGPSPVTAIIALTDDLAMRVVDILEKLRIRVPEDVSVVGFDDLTEILEGYPMTTIRQDFYQKGVVACEKMFDFIRNKTSLKKEWGILPYELIIRESAGRIGSENKDEKEECL
ncbi:MAG: LacI family DNA-binding transcriptional regulator [Lachnospiraceae bacterium]|nr:LacI family DNA-binding transcriptional regulator [Lachnospiraceae bacterium]